jgi:hypothetical protein
MRCLPKKARLLRSSVWGKGNTLPLAGSSLVTTTELVERVTTVRRNWRRGLPDASIRENSGFHGEHFASVWAQTIQAYRPSFLEFSDFRGRAGGGTDRPHRTGTGVPDGCASGIKGSRALVDRGSTGKRALCRQARRQYPRHRPALSLSNVVPNFE